MKIATIAAVAVAGSVASAQFGVFSVDLPDQTFSGVPNFEGEFLFDEFNAADFGDPALITLLSAEITLTIEVTGGLLQLDNDGIDEATVTGRIGATGSLSSDDLFGVNVTAEPVTDGSFTLAGNDGDDDSVFNAGPGEGDFAELDGVDQIDSSTQLFDDGFQAQFEGTGQFALDYDIDQLFDNGGVGGVSFSGVPASATVTVGVRYTYEIVPTPAAAGVFAAAGLVATRRRR